MNNIVGIPISDMLSPGLYINEVNNSYVKGAVENSAVCIIGDSQKGPSFIPAKINSWNEFTRVFGVPTNSQFGGIAVKETLNENKPVIFIRVTPDSAGAGMVTVMDDDTELFSLKSFSESSSTWFISCTKLTETTDANFPIYTLSLYSGNSMSTGTLLEEFDKVTLDVDDDNYISKVIGDIYYSLDTVNDKIVQHGTYSSKSDYVYVNEVSNLNSQWDISTIISATGGDDGDDEIDFINLRITDPDDYSAFTTEIGTDARKLRSLLKVLGNAYEYDIDMFLIPQLNGITHSGILTYLVENVIKELRSGDCWIPVDVGDGTMDLTSVKGQTSLYESSYVGYYYPYVEITNNSNKIQVPISTLLGGVFAYSDRVSAPWYATAGFDTGSLSQVSKVQYKLNRKDIGILQKNHINPVLSYTTQNAIILWGQKTGLKSKSALNRINIRRLLIYIKKQISRISLTFTFKANDSRSRSRLYNELNTLLKTIQENRGITEYIVQCDTDNNTPDIIASNVLVAEVWIKPTITAEYIRIPVNVESQDAIL